MSAGEIAFGPFVLDVTRGRLRRGSALVPLRRKGVAVLRILVARAGRLVTNEELLAAAWPGVTVTPQTLTNVVRDIRVALDDRAGAQRWVRSVRGRGYVFVGGRGPEAVSASPQRWLVGRDAHLERLGALWSQVEGGRSAVALITGAPGIGKTTLAEEVVALVTARTPAVVIGSGACVERHGRFEPYLPFLEAIDEMIGTPGRHPARERLLRLFAPAWLVQFPWRVRPDERSQLDRNLAGAAAGRMLREGLALLQQLAARAPLLIVLEDLHWADQATLDLVVAVARRSLPIPLLVLGTMRTTGTGHPLASVVLQGRATDIPIAPFDGATVAAYLTARFGDAGLARRLAGRVEQSVAGNPLFLGHLVDTLVEQGAIVREDDGTWRIDETAMAAVGVPRTLREAVGAEVDAMPADRRELLATISLAGAPMTAHELAEVTGGDVVAVENWCEALSRAGQLLRLEPASGAEPRRYGFAHEAYRRIVEDRLGPEERSQRSLRLAEALERMYALDLDPLAARLAALYDRGRRPDRSARHFERAAAHAERRFAYRESAEFLRAALARVPSDAAPETSGALQLRLGAALSLAEGYSTPALARTYGEARKLFLRARSGASDPVGVTTGLFLAEMGLGRWAITRGLPTIAHRHTERLLDLAHTAVPEFAGAARYWAGCVSALRGDLPGAQRLLDEATAAPAPPGVLRYTDLRRLVDSMRALVLTSMGRLAAGRAAERAALERSRALGQPADLAHAWLFAAERAAMAGEPARGRTAAAAALRLADEGGIPSFAALARVLVAFFDPAASARARAAAMDDAIRARRGIGDRWHEPMLLGLLAEVRLAAAEPADALAAIDAAMARAAATGERHYEAELHRLRALCLFDLGAPDALVRAAAALHLAMTTARAGGAELWARRAATSLDRLPEPLRSPAAGDRPRPEPPTPAAAGNAREKPSYLE